VKWLLGPYRDHRTYATLAYLLLGLPLGILDFTLVVTGLSLGVGMLVTLVGIPLLAGTLLLVRALAALERRLAWSLLQAPMPRIGTEARDHAGLSWSGLGRLARSRRTWAEMGFELLRLPFGIAGFTVAVTVVSLMGWGLAAPIVAAAGVESTLGSWRIDTIAESLVFLPVSLLFLLVGPRILLGWGALTARATTAMLGRVEPAELKMAIGELLSRRGEADAFQILDALELRFGRGPFVTPVRLQATLLALTSDGRLAARRQGERTLYALAEPKAVIGRR
jgi:hypothetical protein